MGGEEHYVLPSSLGARLELLNIYTLLHELACNIVSYCMSGRGIFTSRSNKVYIHYHMSLLLWHSDNSWDSYSAWPLSVIMTSCVCQIDMDMKDHILFVILLLLSLRLFDSLSLTYCVWNKNRSGQSAGRKTVQKASSWSAKCTEKKNFKLYWTVGCSLEQAYPPD